MKEKKLKPGDKVLITSFDTLKSNGSLSIEMNTIWGMIIKDNTTGIGSSISKTELEEWKEPKIITRIGEINGIETIESCGHYYPTKWVRRRVC